MRLTDAGIKALPFTEKGQRYFVDNAVRGLSVCVGMRTKSFTLIIRTGGSRKRVTLGQYPYLTLAMARERAKDVLAEQRIQKTETPSTRFNDALETYYRVHVSKLRPQSIRGITQTINRRFSPALGKRWLADIKPTDIAPLLDTMLETPTEMHNAFVYLAMFFNWCMRRGYIEAAPTARMQTPNKPPSRERTLSVHELISIWDATADDSDYSRIIRLCILSGQRAGQWASMRREYIQGDVIVWPAEAMKGKRSHTLPLTEGIRTLLPERIGLLFPSDTGRPFSNWSRNKVRLDTASGVTTWRTHDLRRTWATIAADELHIEPHHIEAILAHAFGTQVSRIYNRAMYREPMRLALERYEEWLAGMIHPGTQIVGTPSGF